MASRLINRLARTGIKVDQTASGWPEVSLRWIKLHQAGSTDIKVGQIASDRPEVASNCINMHLIGSNWHQAGSNCTKLASNCIRLVRAGIKVEQTASDWPELASKWIKLHQVGPNCIRPARTGIKALCASARHVNDHVMGQSRLPPWLVGCAPSPDLPPEHHSLMFIIILAAFL